MRPTVDVRYTCRPVGPHRAGSNTQLKLIAERLRDTRSCYCRLPLGARSDFRVVYTVLSQWWI